MPNFAHKQFTSAAHVPRKHFVRAEAGVDINAAGLRMAGCSKRASNYFYAYAAGEALLIQMREVESFNVRVIHSVNKEVRLHDIRCEELTQIHGPARQRLQMHSMGAVRARSARERLQQRRGQRERAVRAIGGGR